MYRFIYKYLLLLIGSMIFFNWQKSVAQSFDLAQLRNDFNQYQQNHLQEKIYVHTDESFYLCGQVIWFKVYLTNAADNHPLSLSKVAYVEILNNNHTPVLQGKIAMKNGVGCGSFYLPFTLPSGNYAFRAYTNWMKNFSSGHYFSKLITIVNTTMNLDAAAVHDSAVYSAQFFPEGGNLVNGIKSEIAFKVTNEEGKGVDFYGAVVDDQQDTILNFRPLQFGMGHFFLTPESGKHYTAIIRLPDSSVIKKELPKAYDYGYVMHVKDTAGFIKISLGVKENDDRTYIIIHNHQHINLAESIPITDNKAVMMVSKDSLQDGISQITVFDEAGRPVCERLYFKRPGDPLLITSHTNKNIFDTRSQVYINITTANHAGNTLAGNLSAAVYRLDDLHQPDENNIYDYLWLFSDIKGYIESPEYYFSANNEATNRALDNLLLTQGWRKFNWENIAGHKSPVLRYVPEISGHIITGRIVNDITGKPAANIMTYISVPGKRIQLHGCISDSNGLVHYDMKDFYGTNQIIVQTNNQVDSTYRMEIFSPFSEQYSDVNLPVFHLTKKYEDALTKGNFSMEVQNTYHGNIFQRFITPKIDSTPFFEQPYKTYMLDDYTRFTTMEEVMREYVTEVNVRRQKKQYRFQTFNAPAFTLENLQPEEHVFTDDPLVLLDGVPVFNINQIIAYNPLIVQKLQVVAQRYHWGSITTDGIVSYTTYKGNLQGFQLNPHALLLDYEGLQEQRVFYAPAYGNAIEKANRLPDFRTLLYWSPNINTDKNGKAVVSFYTGDLPGKYIVVLQGITPQGLAGSDSFTFQVQK